MLSFLLLIMVTRKLNVMKTNQLKRNPWTSGWKTWFSKHATCHRFTAPVLCLAGLSVEVIDTICSEGEVTDHILPNLYKPWEPEWDQEGLYLFIISPLNHQGIMLSTVTVLSAPAAHFKSGPTPKHNSLIRSPWSRLSIEPLSTDGTINITRLDMLWNTPVVSVLIICITPSFQWHLLIGP